MAVQKDLDYTYTLIDKIFRFCFGEYGDFSCALYKGDFSQSLEQAQRQKYEYIYDNLNIKKGDRVLDMGCGWGPFLNFLREKGVKGVGVTLSSGQARACQNNGLDVHLLDCRTIKPDMLGTFDAITSIEAFEAFCSKEEWRAGKQDEIYQKFFKVVYDLLPAKGRFYLQTGTLGKKMIDPEKVDIHADKKSDAYVCAVLERQFPGHWLPSGLDQLVACAAPCFKLSAQSNGRLDYLETQNQWRKKFKSFAVEKYLFYLSIFPTYLSNKALRQRIALFGIEANRMCFERQLMDHYRLIFEKV
ncbi:class I SAM-dependent methyltransferase [candidate division KSB1 bacterium]|nr:class I SAM-dependent methyltransferase [candidate division KSB1 bacterium]